MNKEKQMNNPATAAEEKTTKEELPIDFYAYNTNTKEWKTSCSFGDVEYEEGYNYCVSVLDEDVGNYDSDYYDLGKFVFYAVINSTTKDYISGQRKTLEEAQAEVLKYVGIAATNNLLTS